MTNVIAVPTSLDDESFEQVLGPLAALAPDAKVLLDARRTEWASPYGLIGLLTLAQSRAVKPELIPPETHNTATYWARTGFYQHAEALFEIRGPVPRTRGGAESQVLLEITPVVQSADVHSVVDRIQERAQKILVSELSIDSQASIRFVMTLSEVCQNIVEHAGSGGWVAVQTYKWKKRLGRRYESYWYKMVKGEWTKHSGWPTAPDDWKKILAWIVRRKFAPSAATRASFPREAAKVFRDLFPLLSFTSLLE